MFVGEGTPFGGKPIGITGVLDGTSNTIMVVRAGDVTAEIWTKPGGLAFDKANPIQALGTIGETFDALFMTRPLARCRSRSIQRHSGT